MTRRPDSPYRGTNAPLFGRGYTTAEGAFLVPTIFWWPGKVPAGTTCNELSTTMDLLPTFAMLAKTETPTDRVIDGHDMRPLLFDEPGASLRTKPFTITNATNFRLYARGHGNCSCLIENPFVILTIQRINRVRPRSCCSTWLKISGASITASPTTRKSSKSWKLSQKRHGGIGRPREDRHRSDYGAELTILSLKFSPDSRQSHMAESEPQPYPSIYRRNSKQTASIIGQVQSESIRLTDSESMKSDPVTRQAVHWC